MPFFSRRTFQKMIDENRLFMSEEAISTLIGKLNSGKIDSFPFYWEVFLLNLLSKIGNVTHEKNHGGTTNPDITFTNNEIEFLADITTVSDSDQEKNNDYRYFMNELGLFSKRRGLKYLNGFDIRVSGELKGERGSKKAKISLPPKNLTHSFIKEYLIDFIDGIVNDVSSHQSITVKNEIANISISYNPSSHYTTGGYLDYTSIYSIDKNPIYNSLTNKNKQLKKSGYQGIKGVFICDGDCNELRKKYKSGVTNFSVKDIVNHFFSKKDQLDFVAIMHISHHQNHLSNSSTHAFGLDVFYAKNDMAVFCEKLHCQIKKAIGTFPHPQRTAKNSLGLLQHNNFLPSPSKFGAFNMSNEKITLSSRAILELMTGSVNQADFINEHKYVINALTNKLNSGRLPLSITLLKEESQDDDWVMMDFSETSDPCISKFK